MRATGRKTTPGRYRDRTEAGKVLAELLADYAHEPDRLVLALPRGGVPVGFVVALALDAPLDVFLVRKLGVPGHTELAMGALASGGVRFLNEEVVRAHGITSHVIAKVVEVEQNELERREGAYHGDRPAAEVGGRTVILIDDGLATGSTMRSAIAALRRQRPRRLVVAVPVAAPATCAEIRPEVDDLICARTPEPFHAVGLWYEDFSQTTDEEVRELLELAGALHQEQADRAHPPEVAAR
jgi:predicted phosphoribosyltransferase